MQLQILDNLRKEIKLNVLADFIPSEGMTHNQPLRYTDANGYQYSCVSHVEEETEQSPRNISVTDVLARFRRKCVAFPVDWWSYEWCHQQEVRQFHVEPTKRAKAKRSPDWSLGMFDKYDVTLDSDGTPTEVIEYFSGGQICDENGEMRKAEVILRMALEVDIWKSPHFDLCNSSGSRQMLRKEFRRHSSLVSNSPRTGNMFILLIPQ